MCTCKAGFNILILFRDVYARIQVKAVCFTVTFSYWFIKQDLWTSLHCKLHWQLHWQLPSALVIFQASFSSISSTREVISLGARRKSSLWCYKSKKNIDKQQRPKPVRPIHSTVLVKCHWSGQHQWFSAVPANFCFTGSIVLRISFLGQSGSALLAASCWLELFSLH